MRMIARLFVYVCAVMRRAVFLSCFLVFCFPFSFLSLSDRHSRAAIQSKRKKTLDCSTTTSLRGPLDLDVMITVLAAEGGGGGGVDCTLGECLCARVPTTAHDCPGPSSAFNWKQLRTTYGYYAISIKVERKKGKKEKKTPPEEARFCIAFGHVRGRWEKGCAADEPGTGSRACVQGQGAAGDIVESSGFDCLVQFLGSFLFITFFFFRSFSPGICTGGYDSASRNMVQCLSPIPMLPGGPGLRLTNKHQRKTRPSL